MIPAIEPRTLAVRLAEAGVVVVDVRESDEFLLGHVPGARNMPLSRLPELMPKLPRDRPIHVICQSGRRSAQAAALMRGAGIDAVDVAGGTGEWIAQGRPVETTP